MDCSVIPLTHLPGNLSMVSTTDFFFPAVDDPLVQGAIGCANVLSDMYSMGISRVDTLLMLLAASSDMPDVVRYPSTELMMRGFIQCAARAGVRVTGGQTVLNPWPIIGGVATSVVRECDMVRPENLVVGDVLVLTKPLGTAVAIRPDMPQSSSALAILSMSHLNKAGAELMRVHEAHGATDVTGFGILGHALNLAKAQPSPMGITLHTLPCIIGTAARDARLLQGHLPETSGGLLVALGSKAIAEKFLSDLAAADGTRGWIVGDVVVTDVAHAEIAKDVTLLEVTQESFLTVQFMPTVGPSIETTSVPMAPPLQPPVRQRRGGTG